MDPHHLPHPHAPFNAHFSKEAHPTREEATPQETTTAHKKIHTPNRLLRKREKTRRQTFAGISCKIPRVPQLHPKFTMLSLQQTRATTINILRLKKITD
jgi:hypothetical protein